MAICPRSRRSLSICRAQGVEEVFLAGDQINRVPWHNEVMDFIVDAGWPAIYGNHDLIIGQLYTEALPLPFRDRQRFVSLYWTRDTLRPAHLARVRALPPTLRLEWPSLPPIRIWHGTPGDPYAGIYPFTTTEAASNLLHLVEEPFVVLAHTHRPIERRFRRWMVLNGGSVGLPFNSDPRAQYLLLDGFAKGWQATFRAVEYDHEPLVARFQESGMLEAVGATGELHRRTALSGEPWSSDFAYWLHHNPNWQKVDAADAVTAYTMEHGPGRWAFSGDGT